MAESSRPSGPRRERSPSQRSIPLTFRQRYYARAKYLQKLGRFALALDAARSAWNTAHPQFPVVESTERPAPPRLWGEYMLPQSVADGLDEQAAESQRTGGCVAGGAFAVKLEWLRVVDALCRTWWPAEHFPTWGPGPSHPARWYVSAALVADVRSLGHEAIRRSFELCRLQPVIVFEPLGDVELPTLEDVDPQFLEGVDTVQPPTRPRIKSFEQEASREQRLRGASGRPGGLSADVRGYLHIPIVAGMMREDLSEVMDLAVRAAHVQRERVDAMAVAMLASGLSVRAVANALGLSQDKVRALRSAHPPTSAAR